MARTSMTGEWAREAEKKKKSQKLRSRDHDTGYGYIEEFVSLIFQYFVWIDLHARALYIG